MQLLGRQKRKAGGQIKADLPTEHAQRAGAGPIPALGTVLENIGQEVEVLTLGMTCRHRCLSTREFGKFGKSGARIHAPSLWVIRPAVSPPNRWVHKKVIRLARV